MAQCQVLTAFHARYGILTRILLEKGSNVNIGDLVLLQRLPMTMPPGQATMQECIHSIWWSRARIQRSLTSHSTDLCLLAFAQIRRLVPVLMKKVDAVRQGRGF